MRILQTPKRTLHVSFPEKHRAIAHTRTNTIVCYNERNKKEDHIRVIAGRGHGIAYMFCDASIVSSVRWSSNGC
jgi:hypothetical protein